MALRRLFGCLPAAALAVCVWTGCKGKGANTHTSAELETRCEALAKACGDKDKHVDKIDENCKADVKTQVDKGCIDKAFAVYDCYEKELCGRADKVWALEDLRVLADRQNKCVAERTALTDCTK